MNYSTSESGQILLEYEGSFKRWETFASGKAILKKHGKLASEIEDDATWDEISLNIARGLMVLAPILRPEVIVVGGGVGAHFDKFKDRLVGILNDTMEPMYIPALVEAVHPEKAVIYGCYYHAIDRLAA